MIGQRDPGAALRWAIESVTGILETGGGDTLMISRSTAERLVYAARLAKLPDNADDLTTRVLAAEDSARYWERRFREKAHELACLNGTAEGIPDDTRRT
jgi:hypothetical protein